MQRFDLIIKLDEEEPEAGEVLVEGAIGEQPYTFLLDTGAGRSSVLLDEYTAGFAAVGEHSSSGVFAADSRELITLPLVTLGPLAWREVTLVRMAHHPALRSLIGMDLLKDHRYHFLFDQNCVLVNPPAADAPAARELFVDSKFHPYVDVQVGAEPAGAVWDTGAGITIVDLGLIERHPANFSLVGQSGGTDATGASLQTGTYLMSGAVIGGQEFAPHRVAGVDLSHMNKSTEARVDMIVGYSTMRKANWWFDFPGKKWGLSAGCQRIFNTDYAD